MDVLSLLAHPAVVLAQSVLFSLLLYLLLLRRRPSAERKLSPEEEDSIIGEWEPEPLVPPVDASHHALNPRVVSSNYGKYMTVDGQRCLNLATHNYLGLVENQQCIEDAIEAVKKYGVGSCGPRGFFGTVDIHLRLEQEIAGLMGTEEAILYSYGYSAISSAIPAYARETDIIFCDEGVNFAIQQGVKASRATVFYFRHNDVQHLAELIECHCEPHAKKAGKSKPASRFLIVEGLYINYGDLCPLPEMIELKKKHKVRLFIDDTCAFGVLGAHGRGTVEHYGCDLDDVDMIAASLEYACAAYGGFCTGTHYIIDHQRLSGLGYCFSASLPPLQAAAGLRAILLLKEDKQLVSSLRHQCLAVSRALEQHRDVVSVSGLAISPIKHLRFARRRQHRPELEVECLEKVTQYAHERGYCLTLARYLDKLEHKRPLPSIRLVVTVNLTQEEIASSVQVIADCFGRVLEETAC